MTNKTNISLQFYPTAEGYVKLTQDLTVKRWYDYVYNYTDHLDYRKKSTAFFEDTERSSVSMSYTWDYGENTIDILEQNHYYPFGLKHGVYSLQGRDAKYDAASDDRKIIPSTEHAYKYKYNGKEWQDELGLNMYSMDMRQYDPAIARWVVQDPVIHHSMSPYNAFDNNPVYFADPTGTSPIYNEDLGLYVINGQVASFQEALAYAQNGGNADGSNDNTPRDKGNTTYFQSVDISDTPDSYIVNHIYKVTDVSYSNGGLTKIINVETIKYKATITPTIEKNPDGSVILKNVVEILKTVDKETKTLDEYELLGFSMGYWQNGNKSNNSSVTSLIEMKEASKELTNKIQFITNQVVQQGMNWRIGDGTIKQQEIKSKGNWIMAVVMGRFNPAVGIAFSGGNVVNLKQWLDRSLGVEFHAPRTTWKIYDKNTGKWSENFIMKY